MINLKELRSDRKLTVRDIEDRTGIKYNTYSRYESGERDMSTDVLKTLAGFYDVTIDYLIGYSDCYIYANDINKKIRYKFDKKFYDTYRYEFFYYDGDKRYFNIYKMILKNEDYEITQFKGKRVIVVDDELIGILKGEKKEQ